MAPIVIVGAGQAGATAAGALRDKGYDGEIVLLGEEQLTPYERPPLSKEYLRGESDHHYVRPAEWYADNAVDARLGVRAERVNVGDRAIELAGGRVAFDQAVIATGSRNRRFDWPGLDLPGVYDLRFAPDADAIRAAAKEGAKAVLVGMGFIGAEVAASLRQLGLDVTVVEFATTPLERVLGPELGGAIEALHRDHGVEMHFHEAAERFEGDVPVDNGIPVDATLRTAVDGVWAIGDVARHDHPVFGPVRVEHFDNAVKMGEHVARNLLGANEVFDDAHWFWSDQYDAQIQMSGFAMKWDQTVIRGSVEDRSFAAFLLHEGRLLSTFSMNWKFDVRRSMPLIVSKAHPDPAQLADPEFDLRQLHQAKD